MEQNSKCLQRVNIFGHPLPNRCSRWHPTESLHRISTVDGDCERNPTLCQHHLPLYEQQAAESNATRAVSRVTLNVHPQDSPINSPFQEKCCAKWPHELTIPCDGPSAHGLPDGVRLARGTNADADTATANLNVGRETGSAATPRELQRQNGELRSQLRVADALVFERNHLLDLFPCEVHGRCVPHTLEEIGRLQERIVVQAANIKAMDERFTKMMADHRQRLADADDHVASLQQRLKTQEHNIRAEQERSEGLRQRLKDADDLVEKLRRDLSVQKEQHSECCFIAQGLPGWDQDSERDSEAMCAVRKLRRDFENARAADAKPAYFDGEAFTQLMPGHYRFTGADLVSLLLRVAPDGRIIIGTPSLKGGGRAPLVISPNRDQSVVIKNDAVATGWAEKEELAAW